MWLLCSWAELNPHPPLRKERNAASWEMGKSLCDWSKKDIERDFETLVRIVEQSNFVCRKCARSAGSSKYLCRPKRIPPESRTGSHTGESHLKTEH